PKKYRVVQGTLVPNPVGAQTPADATCPRGTSPLGGGGLSHLGLLFTNMNSDTPTAHGWPVDASNASAPAGGVNGVAGCGKVKGYQVVSHEFTVAANSQVAGAALCPAPKVPIGGGIFSSSGSVGVNINSTVPEAPAVNEWESWMNNASGIDTS